MEQKFIDIAKRIIEKTKADETKVHFRFFPIRGLAFDQANFIFFNEVLSSACQGVKAPIFLGCLTMNDFSIL